MADAVTPEITTSHGASEEFYYGDVSTRKKRLLTRLLVALTTFMVFLATVFCFVRAIHDHTMYLLAVNLLLTSLVVGVMTWWYYKSVIPPERYVFMLFLGMCLIFQSIVTDIYVWQKRIPDNQIDNGGRASPTLKPANTTIHTLHFQR